MPDPATARQPTWPHVYDGWNSLGHPRNSPCQPAEVFRQALEEAWRTRPQAPKLVSVPGLDSDEITQSAEVCGPEGTCAVPQP